MTSSLLLDIQGTQSVDHRDRGVARYILELATAMERVRPGLVDRFLLNPDLTPPAGIEALVATGRLGFNDRWDGGPAGAGVYHVASPFELTVPLRRLWPTEAHRRGLRLVVTLYDVIPEVFPDRYLADAGLRRRYRARRELVRAAEHVLAISQTTADDAVELLGISPDRITVVGGGVSTTFAPPASQSAARDAARSAVPGLEEHFVLYTGGTDGRKNVEGLLAAFARLPEPVRARWQLVVVCSMAPSDRNHFEVRAAELGVGDRLLLTGFAPEEILRLLYQSTDLFVFPSLYEGFGLPVLEATACGAPAIASATSAVGELVDDEARFDPTDPGDIARAMERGLTDDAFRTSLVARAGKPPPRWDEVALQTAAVYERLLARPVRSRRRPRPRIGFVTPLPPQRTGVADHSYRLVESLRRHADVDVFVDEHVHSRRLAPRPPDGVRAERVELFELLEGLRAGYDRVVYAIGNSEFHGGALACLRGRPGVVLAHDVRLSDLYHHASHRRGAVPGGYHATVRRVYGPRVPDDLASRGWLTPLEAERHGVFFVREVAAMAERLLATSQFAARLARLDAAPADVGKIELLPFAMRPPVPRASTDGPPVVATFGVVNEVKQTALVLEAFAVLAGAHPGATLAVVGPAAVGEADALRARSVELGVADLVTITGEVADAEYEAWLGRATVAVQLRARTNGESSAAVADCLASGVATIVTGIGAARELPRTAVVQVEPDVTAAALADEIGALLADAGHRERMGEAARRHAAANDFDRVADLLAGILFGER